jgi:hypothetical protein
MIEERITPPPALPPPIIGTDPSSAPGIAQPVFDSGDAVTPATPIDITGTPILPPPLISNPSGTPVFPPTGTNTAPVPIPAGPLVGPAVGDAPVPPSIPGVVQPQYAGGGSATVPASLFPDFTTTPPSPPIVFANIFNMGAVAPPSTPGQTPPPIVPSSVATIPQLPWNPWPEFPTAPPVNTAPPVVTVATDLQVGSVLNSSTGTWTNATSYAYQWLRDGSPIFPGSGASYTLAEADVGLMIAVIVTAIGAGGEASAESNEVGPVLDAAADPVVVRSGGGTIPPRSPARKRAR